MKAYVIKNKEGKYFAVSSNDYKHYWTTIDFAHYFRELNGTHLAKQEAEEFRDGRYPNCEVLEITIAEGDLEQQIAIYKRALELVCEDISLYEDITTPELKAKCYLDQAKKEIKKGQKEKNNV